ncbi:hypothetical protein GCM10025858_34480 [Alicyclobacillus sacchari]|uniref:hypothetical protein n=1 Tax=Alicyclobacillus sacchari TaxID=392010 RepID=UPI0023E9A429|nr:hypothetical protein [Alicyclobacillus sacchari]GMA58945.1 hypothetical protein GCM10025858_34480 [Alicyclobacillus sacchari]
MYILVFDFHIDGQPAPRYVFTDPVAIHVAVEQRDVPKILREVEAATRDGLYAAGFVTYEAAPAFDPAYQVHAPAKGDCHLRGSRFSIAPLTPRYCSIIEAVSFRWDNGTYERLASSMKLLCERFMKPLHPVTRTR